MPISALPLRSVATTDAQYVRFEKIIRPTWCICIFLRNPQFVTMHFYRLESLDLNLGFLLFHQSVKYLPLPFIKLISGNPFCPHQLITCRPLLRHSRTRSSHFATLNFPFIPQILLFPIIPPSFLHV